MAVATKELWTRVKELLLEEYRRDNTANITGTLPDDTVNRFQGVLRTLIDGLVQPLDDAAVASQNLADIDYASGEWLDLLGEFAGLSRKYGESDASFRARIRTALSTHNAGTPDNVIYNAAILSGDSEPQYMDESTATFFEYTGPRPDGEGAVSGGGRQLSRSEVKQLSPCGVLGLPGAAINANAGDEDEEELLADADGKIFLMAADDSTIERTVLLADNSGNIVISSESVPVKVLLTGATAYSIPTIETTYDGTTVEAVRIKDLPDASDYNSYLVRDSDTEGTTKVSAMSEETLDELWDETEAEE